MSKVDQFVLEFFGPGNDFNLPDGWRLDERFSRVTPFIEDVAVVPGRPVLLPRRQGKRWFVLAKAFGTPMGCRLAEALAAFVGPTYARFNPAPAVPRRDDPVEMALESLGNGPMWRLEILPEKWQAAWHALRLLRGVWHERPVRTVEEFKPVGRLLRDFRIALLSGDEQLSAVYLQRLVASGAFDATNTTFLRIRRHGALGFPERALDGAEVDDLFRIRLPAAIRETMLAAVHRRHLVVASADGDVDAARDVLLQYPQYASLLGGPSQVRHREARSALLALALTYPTSADLETLLVAFADADDPWLLALRERLPAPALTEAEPGINTIRDLIDDGAFEQAWRALAALPAGIVRDRLAVHCVLGLADAVRSTEICQTLNAHGPDYLSQVLPQSWQREAWQYHLDGLGLRRDRVPADWVEFIEGVATGEDLSGLSRNLDEIAHQWPVIDDPSVAAAIAQIPPESPAVSTILDALPLLLDALGEQRAGRSSGVAISLILLSEEFNEAALASLTLALRSFLIAAPNAAEYREAVSSLSDFAPQLVQVRTVDRVLDLVDLLLAGPAVEPGTRAMVCQDLLARVRDLGRRLTPPQIILASELSLEAGLDLAWPSLTPAEQETGTDLRTDVRTVLLYSLQERVLDRVQAALLQLAPLLTVHTSSDHDGSDRLKDQSQASDIALLATRRATHAATGFIERWARGKVVYVPGAGSASMLHAALETLRAAT
ncbi:protein DpdD [Micromonospora echinofusca]|uniref:protein DpdD n=1 Tax=Micromonospora echinofusca TaxID=47858 RepID=UPI00371EBE59